MKKIEKDILITLKSVEIEQSDLDDIYSIFEKLPNIKKIIIEKENYEFESITELINNCEPTIDELTIYSMDNDYQFLNLVIKKDGTAIVTQNMRNYDDVYKGAVARLEKILINRERKWNKPRMRLYSSSAIIFSFFALLFILYYVMEREAIFVLFEGLSVLSIIISFTILKKLDKQFFYTKINLRKVVEKQSFWKERKNDIYLMLLSNAVTAFFAWLVTYLTLTK